VHFDYQYFAYLNKCGHIAIQLDYMPGEFFSDDGQSLICSTHGAEYAPDTGACLGGPCYGVGLEALNIIEDQGQLYLQNDEYQIVSK
jgi:nitrite reductase/ring-hydroxylating ferredoxin subunit